MSKLESALELAAKGFYVFPLIENGKTPAIDAFPTKASRDPERIKRWWTCPVTGWEQDFNIGISTSRFNGKDNGALLVVDVDNKKGKNGDAEIIRLELEGKILPPTLEAVTPTGGRHLFYEVDAPLKQGVDTLGVGLDTRSKGGYVCAHGSVTEKGRYEFRAESPVAKAPEWLRAACGQPREAERTTAASPAQVDQDRARQRAVHYLENEAPTALEGAGGDQLTFVVAARVKDFGVSEAEAVALLLDHWNDHCQPPWPADELETKVRNAYRYGKEAPGASAPEADFPAVDTSGDLPEKSKAPVAKLNDTYAIIKRGASILWETTDEKGRPVCEWLNQHEFNTWFANKQISFGKGTKPLSEAWLEWPGRREYDGVVFAPEQDLGPRWYNMWRGFSVKPAATADHPAVKAFVEHAEKNVCGGDKNLSRWLIGYFAHMVQKPWEKALTTLVFKGKKGTGKNALVERVGALFDHHFMVADDQRYLLSNFNAHLESCLFMVLDEAAWAGDKKAEGRLKGITTGSHHNIERKGKEAYKVQNLTRVAIIGNEAWLVPATYDERRFAVFNLGDGRIQDRKFFREMREGMEAGGYARLLRYLMDFDLTGIEVDLAPNTEGLHDQKLASLDPLPQWWHDSLEDGHILGGDFEDEWPEEVSCARLRDAYANYARRRNIRSRTEDSGQFGKAIKAFSSVHPGKKRSGDKFLNTYKIPTLEQARREWEQFIGHAQEWDQ